MTKAAAGEHRKATTFATSAGVPQRPIGVRARMGAERAGSSCSACVNGVRDVRGREHAGGRCPSSSNRGADAEHTLCCKNEVHRVVRMQRLAHAGTANGKQRRPGLGVQSCRDGRQWHAVTLAA